MPHSLTFESVSSELSFWFTKTGESGVAYCSTVLHSCFLVCSWWQSAITSTTTRQWQEIAANDATFYLLLPLQGKRRQQLTHSLALLWWSSNSTQCFALFLTSLLYWLLILLLLHLKLPVSHYNRTSSLNQPSNFWPFVHCSTAAAAAIVLFV